MPAEPFKRNLAALNRVNRPLASRLMLPMASDHVRVLQGSTDQPAARYLMGHEWRSLAIDPATRATLMESATKHSRLMLFGVGLGELLEGTLRARPDAEILAWERDPWLLRLLLTRVDLEDEILSRRLELALSADLFDHLPWRGGLIAHPLLSVVYRNERILLEQGVGRRRALVAAGELFTDDLADALRNRGYSVFTWEIRRHSREELQTAREKVAPELVAAINYTHGLPEMCREMKLPLLCWEVDPALDRIAPRCPCEHTHIFTWRKANVSFFKKAGFASCTYLPLATSPQRRVPEIVPKESPYRVSISFVGASMVTNALECRDRFLQLHASQREPASGLSGRDVLEKVMDHQRADWSVYRVPEALEQLCPGWRAEREAAGEVDPALLVGEIAAAEKRMQIVARLGRLGVQVWGDEGWKRLEPFGVRYRGPAGHRVELNHIYSGSAVNVDINRIYQPDIVTMRVFDVIACGGFVLAEQGEALSTLLRPGFEIETWASIDELLEKSAWYIANPDKARRISSRGRDRVLRDHTILRRVDIMLSTLQNTITRR